MPFVHKDKLCTRATYSCLKCCRPFTEIEDFIQHLKHSSKHQSQAQEIPESCSRCRRIFANTRALIQHLQHSSHHVGDLHHFACKGDFLNVSKLMTNYFANIRGDSHKPSNDQTGFTPMHCAAFGGHYECLVVMLSWTDGKPNVVDPKDGRTPVHLAAWKGHMDCLKLLLKHGGELFLRDRSGATPLDLMPDHHRLLAMFTHFSGSTLDRRRSQASRRDVQALEMLRKQLGTKISPRVIPSPCIEELSESPAVCQALEIVQNTEDTCGQPYEVLARGEIAVKIFNQALLEGKAQVTRMQLTVLGNVGVGKTSLVRNLSGEEFVEERSETHGIITSMVEMTELDNSWHTADLNSSHVDDILSDKVCKGIKEGSVIKDQGQSLQGADLRLASGSPHSVQLVRYPSIEYTPESSIACSSHHPNMVAMPSDGYLESSRSNSQQKSPRDLPVKEISRKLSKASLNEGETEQRRKYTKISIWDFAGHLLYEAMHHVFLNRRSFYIVVTNLVELGNPETRDGALEKLYFWLNSVRVHTPLTSSIFLVGTHRDQVSQEDIFATEKVLGDKLLEMFGQQLVRNCENSLLFTIENKCDGEDQGAMKLKKAVEVEASRLSLMDEELPVLWLHFEEEILKYREDPDRQACTTKTSLKESLLQSHCQITDDMFESMLQFYHDSGVIILPEELIGPETRDPRINDLVVVKPQYLVDVMTYLHDIPDHIDVERQHCSQWKTLQDSGITDLNFLGEVWKNLENSPIELVSILEASGMLCPISALKGMEGAEGCGEGGEGDEEESEVCRYIVPCHLKTRCLKRKWGKLCRKTWSGICNADKILIYDFHNFLPPALFNYFIVRAGAKSQASDGMRPIVAKEMAIFSFSDSFFILTETCQKYNQIIVRARYKNGKKLHELFDLLKAIMTDICQRQFKFLKFSFGPFCPNPRCPGASACGEVLPEDRSSDESDDEKDNSTCEEAAECDSLVNNRSHVIPIDPALPSRPLWCNSTPVHEFEEITQWFKESQETVFTVPEDSTRYYMKIEVCCKALVAKATANKWKWLGRALSVGDTIINNIKIENESEEERCYQVISHWEQTNGGKATAHHLIKSIEEVGITEAMEIFDRHLAERHDEES